MNSKKNNIKSKVLTTAFALGFSALSLTSEAVGKADKKGGGKAAAPTSLKAKAVSSGQINLSWKDNSNNEDYFKIYRSSDNKTFSFFATTGADVTTYKHSGLDMHVGWKHPKTGARTITAKSAKSAKSVKFYYRVRASNKAGDSAFSNTTNATIRR